MVLPPYLTVNNPVLQSELVKLGQHIKNTVFPPELQQKDYINLKYKFQYLHNGSPQDLQTRRNRVNNLMKRYNANISKRLKGVNKTIDYFEYNENGFTPGKDFYCNLFVEALVEIRCFLCVVQVLLIQIEEPDY